MDKIIIKNAKFLCNVGITQKERSVKQEILLDVIMFYDMKKSAKTDSIKDTVDYFSVYKKIENLIKNKEFSLIETIAQISADLILENFNVQKVIIIVKKPNAIKDAKYCGVEIERSINV